MKKNTQKLSLQLLPLKSKTLREVPTNIRTVKTLIISDSEWIKVVISYPNYISKNRINGLPKIVKSKASKFFEFYIIQ